MPSSHFQLAHKILYLLSLNERTLLNVYEEVLGIHRGESDEGYLEQWTYSKYLEGKLVSDCYLLPHECQNIWVRILPQNRNPDIDGMHIIPSFNLLSSIKVHLKNGLRKITMDFIDSVNLSLSKNTGKGFNPADISYSLQCCQLMLLVHNSAVTLLWEYHSIEQTRYFPLCTNFVQWIEFMKIGFNHLQSSMKQWLKEHDPARRFDFLKLWEQVSVVKLTPEFRRFLESQSSAKCYKIAIRWIDACNEVINDPLKSCSIFFNDCLPELTLSDYTYSTIDSISVYGTIALAMLSCVSDSPTPIIIPHMYYRALQVYDSLLPNVQNENILDSCCSKLDRMEESNSAIYHKLLLQYLHTALNQIESLLQNPRDLVYLPDLTRLTTILMLTLYMNYASETPDSSNLHSKFVHCLKEQQKFQHFCDFNSQAVFNAFQEAKNPSTLLRILKYLLCPDSKKERYESLAIIYFSKHHKKIIIESVDDEDIRLPPEIQAQELPDQQHMPISPLIPKNKRQQRLYFSIPCKHVYHGPLRTESSAPIWMHYKERSEDVHEHVREFIHQVISKDPALSSTIRGKTLFQQYLCCLYHVKVTESKNT